MRTLRQVDGWFVVHDGCIEIRWHNNVTDKSHKQRKRRPAGAKLETCTWHASLYCADHPNR